MIIYSPVIQSLKEVRDTPLRNDGTQLTISAPKVQIDEPRLVKEIRKLAILRQHPLFEVYIKRAEQLSEWNFSGAQIIRAPDIQGHRIPIDLDGGKITGELAIARRPLSDDERGIAIMIGNHIVLRTSFGFESKLNRVTGYVRQDNLTSRFADKSAIIENEEYNRFNKTMRVFIADTVIPSLADHEDVLITREESKLYKQMDKVLGQAVIETLEPHDEIEGYEIVETTSDQNSKAKQPILPIHDTTVDESIKLEKEYSDLRERQSPPAAKAEYDEDNDRPSVEIFSKQQTQIMSRLNRVFF